MQSSGDYAALFKTLCIKPKIQRIIRESKILSVAKLLRVWSNRLLVKVKKL